MGEIRKVIPVGFNKQESKKNFNANRWLIIGLKIQYCYKNLLKC